MKELYVFCKWDVEESLKYKPIITFLKKSFGDNIKIKCITLYNKNYYIEEKEYDASTLFDKIIFLKDCFELLRFLKTNIKKTKKESVSIYFFYNHKELSPIEAKLYLALKLILRKFSVNHIPKSIFFLENYSSSSYKRFEKIFFINLIRYYNRKIVINSKISILYCVFYPYFSLRKLWKKLNINKAKFDKEKIINNPQKILFIRVDRFGDMVLTLPTLVELKQAFPNAELHLLCSPRGKGIVENQNTVYKFLDRIIVWKNIWDMHGGLIPGVKHFLNMLQLIFQLRRTKYDVVIQPIPLSIWTFLALLLKSKIIISTINCNLPLSRWLKKYIEYPILIKKGKYIHYAQQSFNCLVPFGIKKGVKRDFKLKYSVERVNLTVRKFIPNRINNNIVVNLSAGDKGRKLSKEKILQLINKLNINFMDYKIILIGTQEDKILSDEIENNFSNIINLVGETSIDDLIYIFYNSKILITPDTGTMHLASFTDIFVVAYFGAGNLLYFAPLSKKSIVIKHELGCSGCGDICFTKAYPKPCIDKIIIDEILEAVKKALERVKND